MTRKQQPTRILHLDDSPWDAMLVELTLESGQKVFPTSLTYVRNKAEFMAILEFRQTDVILCDYRMPGFDGEEALKYVKEKFPQLPFIIITGELREELAAEVIQRGATDYVLKDEMGRLIPAIQHAVVETRANGGRPAAQ